MSSTRCSDLHWCYLQQTVHFFQSDTHPVIRKKSPLLDLQSYFWSKGPRSDKPSHKHDSNKYQTKAFVICEHKSDQTRSAAYVNETYLVWLMYWLLFNQHYQHRTNQKLRSWANAVFQNRGVCGQAFPSFPSPSPLIPFFSLSSQLSRRTSVETLAMQAKMVVESFSNKWCEKRARARERLFCTLRNSPFNSYRWKRGWSWRCFGTNLPDYYANYVVLMLSFC